MSQFINLQNDKRKFLVLKTYQLDTGSKVHPQVTLVKFSVQVCGVRPTKRKVEHRTGDGTELPHQDPLSVP